MMRANTRFQLAIHDQTSLRLKIGHDHDMIGLYASADPGGCELLLCARGFHVCDSCESFIRCFGTSAREKLRAECKPPLNRHTVNPMCFIVPDFQASILYQDHILVVTWPSAPPPSSQLSFRHLQ